MKAAGIGTVFLKLAAVRAPLFPGDQNPGTDQLLLERLLLTSGFAACETEAEQDDDGCEATSRRIIPPCVLFPIPLGNRNLCKQLTGFTSSNTMN